MNAAVIYWSMTGNTEAMAAAVADGARDAGLDVTLCRVSEIDVDTALNYDVLALGCPAMGYEVLEELEFRPFFSSLKKHLAGRKVALFGSYDWGIGQWMFNWEDRTLDAGAVLVNGQGLMVNNTPNQADLERCRALGAALA